MSTPEMSESQRKIFDFLNAEGGKVRMNDLRLASYSHRSFNILRNRGIIIDYFCPETNKAYFKLVS